jgi:heme-degrading monooxygenase HmoA
MKSFRPHFAVIFTSTQTKHTKGYAEMAKQMETLAKQQKGYIGIDSAKNDNALGTGIGITVSYWESLEAIKNWKANTEHLFAQQKGRSNGIIGTT